MRKRKPPILLATILILFATVTFAFNYRNGVNEKAALHDQDDTPKVGDPRAPTSNTQTASDIKKEMAGQPAATPSGPGKAGPGADGAGMMPPEMAKKMNQGRSTAFLPKPGAIKPTPNDSGTATQWYSSETNDGSKK
ncbi:MAG TPA: hypothetical protein VG944_03375 [Fimbriimonas sp.]|nr:hypothetical protein [Fimbriimonas sp.]